jgi:DNA-directed RNA polymerase specialized sigma24 family protein
MKDNSPGEVTRLLAAWGDGDREALTALLPLVYDELRRLARSYMRRERTGHTLQTTSLVHEAYLRLVDQKTPWANRAHFFGIAAQAMRRVLLDHEKSRQTAKRGAGSAMLLGTGAYESVVVAPNFQGAPTSLEHARAFYHATNPGTFFRVLSPATQLFLLLALVCNWKPAPGTRWRLAGALALAILGDVITFQFHYPRNAILFGAPLTNTPAYYDRAAQEWAIGNYVRVSLILTAVVLVMVSMIRIARKTAPPEHGSFSGNAPQEARDP